MYAGCKQKHTYVTKRSCIAASCMGKPSHFSWDWINQAIRLKIIAKNHYFQQGDEIINIDIVIVMDSINFSIFSQANLCISKNFPDLICFYHFRWMRVRLQTKNQKCYHNHHRLIKNLTIGLFYMEATRPHIGNSRKIQIDVQYRIVEEFWTIANCYWHISINIIRRNRHIVVCAMDRCSAQIIRLIWKTIIDESIHRCHSKRIKSKRRKSTMTLRYCDW